MTVEITRSDSERNAEMLRGIGATVEQYTGRAEDLCDVEELGFLILQLNDTRAMYCATLSGA